jgi:hypothetical protein
VAGPLKLWPRVGVWGEVTGRGHGRPAGELAVDQGRSGGRLSPQAVAGRFGNCVLVQIKGERWATSGDRAGRWGQGLPAVELAVDQGGAAAPNPKTQRGVRNEGDWGSGQEAGLTVAVGG